ncbi:MAG TPA: hypothetical protein VFT51_14345 [Bacillales bacterium]|nr:hypothetical protein [Bacillales bacterium]
MLVSKAGAATPDHRTYLDQIGESFLYHMTENVPFISAGGFTGSEA